MSYKSLAEARAALQSKAVLLKTQTARVESQRAQYEYHYANLADLLEATRDLRAECGIDLSDRMLPETVAVAIMLGIPITEVPAASPTVLFLTVRHVGSGEAEHTIEPIPASLWGRAQELGSYLTFHRRYGYLGLLGLAAEDDDGQAAQRAAERDQQPPPATTKQPRKQQPAPDLASVCKGLDDATTLEHVGRWCRLARKRVETNPEDEHAISSAVRLAQTRVARTLRPDGDLRDALMSGDRARMDAALAASGIVDRGEQGCYLAWAAEMGDTVPPAWAHAAREAKAWSDIDRLRAEMRGWGSEARKRAAAAILQDAEHRLTGLGVTRRG